MPGHNKPPSADMELPLAKAVLSLWTWTFSQYEAEGDC